jgi:hypothetical protein
MFFTLMIMVFVFTRIAFGRRRRFAHAFFLHHHYSRGYWHPRVPTEPITLPAPPRRSTFDLLRERYVNDDITVEQYEDELDVLMRTPEGRKQV